MKFFLQQASCSLQCGIPWFLPLNHGKIAVHPHAVSRNVSSVDSVKVLSFYHFNKMVNSGRTLKKVFFIQFVCWGLKSHVQSSCLKMSFLSSLFYFLVLVTISSLKAVLLANWITWTQGLRILYWATLSLCRQNLNFTTWSGLFGLDHGYLLAVL